MFKNIITKPIYNNHLQGLLILSIIICMMYVHKSVSRYFFFKVDLDDPSVSLGDMSMLNHSNVDGMNL